MNINPSSCPFRGKVEFIKPYDQLNAQQQDGKALFGRMAIQHEAIKEQSGETYIVSNPFHPILVKTLCAFGLVEGTDFLQDPQRFNIKEGSPNKQLCFKA